MANLRQIEIFHAVYQAGSVSLAARLLGITQPTVSKVLKHTQDQLGFDLFRVVRGRLVATQEAHRLIVEAAEVRARVESFNNASRQLRQGSSGQVRLAVIDSLGIKVVPTAIAIFSKRSPAVSFDIKIVHSEQVVTALNERSCDFAIALDPPIQARLHQTKVGTGELVLLYRRDDIVDPPARLSLAMLGRRSLIHLASEGRVGCIDKSRADDATNLPAQIVVQTFSVAGALVREGAGVAVLDQFAAKALLTPELDYRPLVDMEPLNVCGVNREDQPLSRVATAFMSSVREALAA